MFCEMLQRSEQHGVRRSGVITMNNGLTRRRGFTLVELMVVIVIIGMLAGVVTFSVRGYLITSKQNVAKMEIAKVAEAINTFYTVNDRYPTNDEGIVVLTQPSKKFADGILSKVPRDPWGNDYQYTSPGRKGRFEIVCYGADKREGGEGADTDITSDDLGDSSK